MSVEERDGKFVNTGTTSGLKVHCSDCGRVIATGQTTFYAINSNRGVCRDCWYGGGRPMTLDEIAADEYVKGGQGRTSAEIEADGAGIATLYVWGFWFALGFGLGAWLV